MRLTPIKKTVLLAGAVVLAAQVAACTPRVANRYGQIVRWNVAGGDATALSFDWDLFLVAGNNRLDTTRAAELAGEKLDRADPRLIRERTGFAIGGVAPIGHLEPIAAFADETLLGYDVVWAAAGAHDAVFSAEPEALLAAANAQAAAIAA